MKHPAAWQKAELHAHLQHALDLELWTIPLYLCSLFSIRGLAKTKHADYPEAAKLILSVVIQEMLHAELVCNISHALGYHPRFHFPVYDPAKGIPFIHPSPHSLPQDIRGYQVKAHPLGHEALQLFCAIEFPHPNREIAWEKEQRYGTIAELYRAIQLGVAAHWDAYFVGREANTLQKNAFKEYHNQNGRHHGFSIMIQSPEDAQRAVEAIIEQGEGADSGRVPADFRPPTPEKGKEFDTAWYRGNLSHYHKFRILLHSHQLLPPVYELAPEGGSFPAQAQLKEALSGLWKEMEASFGSAGEKMSEDFWTRMFAVGGSLDAVWRSGACPDLELGTSGGMRHEKG